MKRCFAWLFFLFVLGVLPAIGQNAVTQDTKLEVLSASVVLQPEDLLHAAETHPHLIDRWYLKATAGWTIVTYPEGKGEPPYPVLSEETWKRYTPLDLELMGDIHRLHDRPNRYRIGNTRQILNLLPGCRLNTILDQERTSNRMNLDQPQTQPR